MLRGRSGDSRHGLSLAREERPGQITESAEKASASHHALWPAR